MSASWALGTKGTVNGSDIINSASLATSNDERAIFQRVWKGQVSVIFPYIEEERIKLLNEFDSSLRLPIETDHGTITDLFDLEIGNIFHLLVKTNISNEKKSFIKSLRDARNDLAHLRPTPMVTIERIEYIRAS